MSFANRPTSLSLNEWPPRISWRCWKPRIAPAAMTFVWDGEAGDGKWTTAANWVGDVAPIPGAALIFQPEVFEEVTNDFPAGTEFESLTFSGTFYKVTGMRSC
jgi:hypothetical protein